MRQVDILSGLPPSPVRGYLVAAIRQLHPPTRRVGARQSKPNVKVRGGEAHPARLLDQILVEERAAGAPLTSALNVARALRQAVLVLWGAVPDVRDPRAAHLAEQDAQRRTDALQDRVFSHLAAAADCELDALEVLLEAEIAAKEGLQLTLTAERARRAGQHGGARATA